MKIFITGGTGFLGRNLINEIAPDYDMIYVLTRNIQTDIFQHLSNVTLVKGDITNPEIFFDLEQKKTISNEVNDILHAAAFYDIKATHEECYLQNVLGTQNLLYFANKVKSLKNFFYISTIAVCDDQKYFCEEGNLPKRSNFSDHYSKTKYLAEAFIRETAATRSFKCSIIRPGIIIGNSLTGVMDKVDGPYYFINALRAYLPIIKKLKVVPFSYNPRSSMPIIPVDHCAHFIKLILLRSESLKDLDTFHLISNQIPSIREFLDDLFEIEGIDLKLIPVPRNIFHNTLLKTLGIPKELIPFMFSKVSYEKTATNKIVPEIKTSNYSEFKASFLKK